MPFVLFDDDISMTSSVGPSMAVTWQDDISRVTSACTVDDVAGMTRQEADVVQVMWHGDSAGT